MKYILRYIKTALLLIFLCLTSFCDYESIQDIPELPPNYKSLLRKNDITSQETPDSSARNITENIPKPKLARLYRHCGGFLARVQECNTKEQLNGIIRDLLKFWEKWDSYQYSNDENNPLDYLDCIKKFVNLVSTIKIVSEAHFKRGENFMIEDNLRLANKLTEEITHILNLTEGNCTNLDDINLYVYVYMIINISIGIYLASEIPYNSNLHNTIRDKLGLCYIKNIKKTYQVDGKNIKNIKKTMTNKYIPEAINFFREEVQMLDLREPLN